MMSFLPERRVRDGLEAELRTDLVASAQSLAKRIAEYTASFEIIVAGCHWAPAGHCEYDAQSKTIKIVIDPYRADEPQFLRELVIPHELAHGVQILESGVDLASSLSSGSGSCSDLFTHPRVYRLLIEHGASAAELQTAHFDRVESNTKWGDPDSVFSWINSSLSSMPLADVRELFSIRDQQARDGAWLLDLLVELEAEQGALGDRERIVEAASAIANWWQGEIKPAIQRGALL